MIGSGAADSTGASAPQLVNKRSAIAPILMPTLPMTRYPLPMIRYPPLDPLRAI
ncbi:MAG: hypothetical protein AAGF01_17235 [Cyanobacteria bacterium P01_G01_bin.38]